MKAEVTIVIPTRFDSRFHLELCLKSIAKYTTYPHRIIIGNAGVDEETEDFLQKQAGIQVVNCPDPMRPKDFLVRQVDTPLFLILHDDIQIVRPEWLERRVEIMSKRPNVGIVGMISANVHQLSWWKSFSRSACLHKRFFPFAMLVRKEVQAEMDLMWGKVGGALGFFDTGAIAYQQFLKQNKWKFYEYNSWPDVKHWNCKTWAIRWKKFYNKDQEKIDKVLAIREKNIQEIKKILQDNNL